MPLKYKANFEASVTTFRLSGPINEHVAEVLEEMRPQVKTPRVVFDLENLTYINSIGAATWMAHLKAFEDLDISFVKCPAVFTSLCLMMPDLTDGGRIDSLFLRYHCPACEESLPDQLVRRADLEKGQVPPRPCPNAKCKKTMIVDAEDEDFRDLLLTQKSA